MTVESSCSGMLRASRLRTTRATFARSSSIEEAFREYERLRMPRVATINKLCRLTWASSAVESKLLCAARDAAMRYALPKVADKQLQWLLAGQGLGPA